MSAYDSHAAVFRIHRVREQAGRNFLAESITVPAALFTGLSDERAMVDDIVSLAQHYGILLGRGEERISTVVRSSAVAQAPGVTPGMPVTMLDRVLFMLEADRPVEWRIAYAHLAGSHYVSEIT